MCQIADLHCDLLLYLAEKSGRSPYDVQARCSIPQLREGNVKFQTLAIFAETASNSADLGWLQVELFSNLLSDYSEEFVRFERSDRKKSAIQILPAIENASSFCSEKDSLEEGLNRLEQLIAKIGNPLYITMTWNTENRFGGGAHTNIGLKEDGRRLMEFLDGRGIAIDFSHTSDALAREILNYIDRKNLDIPVLASHSNFRSICDVARNLPDDIAQEIFRRKGMIGLNIIRAFVGPEDPSNFARHLEHGLKLGGEEQLCFGADFFYEEDVSSDHRKRSDELFFPEFGNATVYPQWIEIWNRNLSLSQETINKIAHDNLLRYLKNVRNKDT